MGIDRIPGGREPALGATRWSRLPQPGALARGALVAALLALAAGVLYAGESGACPAPAGAVSSPSAALVESSPSPAAVGSSPLPGRRALPPGHVGVAVRLTEPATLAVVQPGALVDLLAVPVASATKARGSTLVAARALVLDVVGAGTADGMPALYLALRPEQAQRTVEMPADTRFAIIVR